MSNSLFHRVFRLSTRPLTRSPTAAFRRSSQRLYSASTAPPEEISTASRVWTFLRRLSIASSLSLTAYTVGSLYPPTLATYISPRIAPPPPDPDHPSSIAYVSSLESDLQTLPALETARHSPDADEWYETRPYLNLPEERRVNSLTAGALRGPGRLALPPLVRARKDEKESWIFVHVGRGVCGHDGIVHGGLLATLLDEGLARIAIQNLPDKIGVTANLNINYRAPTRADQFIVMKTRLIEAKGRKTQVSARLEDLQGTLLAEASATFVQPKYSKLLNTSHIRAAMGENPKSDVPIVEGAVAPVPMPIPVRS
ncbi:hypothetical protein JAAARDRAFT_28741 [Jaapia argillacea MUCL 33604]|uniref:Thioesterase domain-containing protein n=1 Tax=Jaapia argillacea MUCL 33604 TaxID=933084 RepID=A0A067QNF0_9AGAM|nr:hypothetical protein JAAARDRAFT_28741 [Jaapia argillacea MUCL 33604]